MTHSQYLIGRKVNIVDLGQTLGNISEACRKLGVSRQLNLARDGWTVGGRRAT